MLAAWVRRVLSLRLAIVLSVAGACVLPGLAHAATAKTEQSGQPGSVTPNAYGGLDCNGLSPIQHPAKVFYACADVHSPSAYDGRFWENGRYIGHDEPDLNYSSPLPGSGNDTTWTFRLGNDPAAAPTSSHPGSDVSHYFELTPAVWFSMIICDP